MHSVARLSPTQSAKASAHRILFTVAVLTVIASAACAVSLAEDSQRPAAPSTKLARLYNFCSLTNCTDGSYPTGLIQGLDGNFYGTANFGGIDNSACTRGCGTIFKITPEGSLTTLYSFCSQTNCSDGYWPGSLTLGEDGNFYGVTGSGGATNNDNCKAGCGTLFRITSQGTLTTLYNFDAEDSYSPSGVFWGSDGNVYGSAYMDVFGQSFGQVFVVSPQGTVSFFLGAQSVSAAWFQGPDAQIYGTTTPTCDQYCTVEGGWVFQMSADGTTTTLYDFCPAESNCAYFSPYSLTQTADGNLYGVVDGGNTNSNLCFQYNTCGVVYQLTLGGVFTPIYNFCSLTKCADGANPYGLLAGSDGNIYGEAGPNAGNIFELTPAGALTTLYRFCSAKGCGIGPSSLVQATDGSFYGATGAGGSNGGGTVYRLATGLPPFVSPMAKFGPVGAKIRILGNNLKSTTAVSFNGTVASFTAGSNTNLTATVPAGATSGLITVTTPKGTLSSNVVFQVVQ